MDQHLSGRVALVTGGSKGIGRGTALALAQAGAELAICARGARELERTAEEIRSATGRRCLAVPADLSTLEGCTAFVRAAADHYGRADILVCSANTPSQSGGTLFTIPDEEWVYHLSVKFLSAVRCSREAVPHMQSHRWGRIVLISGMAARQVSLTRMDNGPACAALANFGKQLAAQVIGDGIRVNTIHPGPTQTARRDADVARQARMRGVPEAEIGREMVAAMPMGRLIQPAEVAGLVAFLCSELADAITGQSIAVDGGVASGIHY